MGDKKRKENLGPSPILLWIIVIVLIVAVFFLINSALFNVTEISVEGNYQFSSEDIIRLSGIDYETNIIHVDEYAAIEGIQQNPYLVVENIERVFPTGVKIKVKERVAIAQIGTVNGYYIIDKEGIVLALQQVKNDYLVEVTNMAIAQPEFGKVLISESADKLNGMNRVLEAIEEYQLYGKIVGIDLNDPHKIQLNYNNEITVQIAGSATAKDRLKNIEVIVEAVKNSVNEGQILYLESDGGYYIG